MQGLSCSFLVNLNYNFSIRSVYHIYFAFIVKDSASIEEQLGTTKEARDGSQEAYDGFVKQCDTGLTFEERMEARKAEIQSLKEALEVLQNA